MQNNFRPVQPLNGRTIFEADTGVDSGAVSITSPVSVVTFITYAYAYITYVVHY